MSTSLSFRTDDSVRDEIDKVAESLDRNRNWVINKAIENYLDQYRWELQEIDSGFKELDEGHFVEGEEVKARFEELFRTATKTSRVKMK